MLRTNTPLDIERQVIYARSYGRLSVLCKGVRLYHAHSPQLHCHTAGKPKPKYNGEVLNYATTQPVAIVTYRISNMIIAAHSDALYLSKINTRIRVGVISAC